ncbi:transporter substrate-binding domain-containing protein [Colwellia sp. BRX10-3]|uniref:substrate-binding periplasmic protein n=1 Tax=Colwellia sp. BRX10-3 TaxID=2759844 RepID=UPI0015F72651|nr:transporter substrate-binding domain-containing protein [Colwellia sp. BRX10-3]MBA6392041.1 transporter substrate-binding domain-containing protein [Colwellia sp. BRX10-3]
MSLLKMLSIAFCGLNLMHLPSYASSDKIYINNVEWPPFFFSDQTRDKIGLGNEILSICLKQTNYQPEYKTLPVKRTHLYMQMGELDISVYSHKTERNGFVYYGKEPIFTSTYTLASKKDKKIAINKLDDLNNYIIGHLSGLTHTPELLRIIDHKAQKNEVSIGHSVEAMFNQMLATPQRFDIMPNSKETFLWNAKQLGILDKITIHDLFIAEKNYYITVSKFSKNITKPIQLLENLDTCIQNLKANGSYQKIALQYGL